MGVIQDDAKRDDTKPGTAKPEGRLARGTARLKKSYARNVYMGGASGR